MLIAEEERRAEDVEFGFDGSREAKTGVCVTAKSDADVGISEVSESEDSKKSVP